MKILIASPARVSIMVAFYESVLKLLPKLQERNISWHNITIDHADIIYSRNCLGSYLYEHKDFSHILFLDSDMVFEPSAVLRLIDFDSDFVGCSCPLRVLDSRKVNEATKKIMELHQTLDIRKSLSLSYTYNIWPYSGAQISSDGFVRVHAIGGAIVLIKRRVFDDMISSGIAKPRIKPHPVPPFDMKAVYNFFDLVYLTETDYVSEDFSFCKKWTDDCKGKIWALVDERIGHIGAYNFLGRNLDKLELGFK